MAELQKVEALWFHDGTIVIQAGHKIFRVYSGILAQRSATFKDMLISVDPPPYQSPMTSEESYGQCPVIRVDDDPEDMEIWMTAIFDPSFLRTPGNIIAKDKPLITQLIAVARLSEKYRSPAPKRLCFMFLDSILPMDLDKVDLIWRGTRNYILNIKDAPSIILLCDEVKAEWLMPSLYYLAAIEPSNLLLSNWSNNHTIFEIFLLGIRRQCLQHPLIADIIFQFNRKCKNKCSTGEAKFNSARNYNNCLIKFSSDVTSEQTRLKSIQTMDPLRIVAQRYISTENTLFDSKFCAECKEVLWRKEGRKWLHGTVQHLNAGEIATRYSSNT